MKNNAIRFYHSIDLPTTPDNASWAPHLHNDYEILFVYSVENAYFNISGLKYQLKSFDLVFLKPAVIHNRTIPYTQNYERCGLYFPESAIPRELKSAVGTFKNIYHLSDTGHSVFKIIDSLSDAEKSFSKEDLSAYLPSALTQILYHLKYAAPTEEVIGLSNNTVDKILKYIDQHIAEPLNAEIISKQCIVSKSWLSHNFKELLGISLKKYINHLMKTFFI